MWEKFSKTEERNLLRQVSEERAGRFPGIKMDELHLKAASSGLPQISIIEMHYRTEKSVENCCDRPDVPHSGMD